MKSKKILSVSAESNIHRALRQGVESSGLVVARAAMVAKAPGPKHRIFHLFFRPKKERAPNFNPERGNASNDASKVTKTRQRHDVIEPLPTATSNMKENAERDPSYEECIDFARKAIANKDTLEAARWLNSAFALDTSRAEAYNVLGIISETKQNRLQAQKYYRAAIALNPTYEPAYNNLRRITRTRERVATDLGASFQK